jgi:hypothetical protein
MRAKMSAPDLTWVNQDTAARPGRADMFSGFRKLLDSGLREELHMVDLLASVPYAVAAAATTVASSPVPVEARNANANAIGNLSGSAPVSGADGRGYPRASAQETGNAGPASRPFGAALPSSDGIQMVYVYDAQAHKALVRILDIVTQAIAPDAAAEDAGSGAQKSSTENVAPHIDTSA